MILVCGGAGYIGSHTVYKLINQGVEVAVVDNLQKGHREALHPNAKLYVGDIRDTDFLYSVFEENDINAVIHFAANSLVGESMEKPLEYYSNNVHGTLSLLKAMEKHGVKKIVFSSTAAVYGQPNEMPIAETHKTNPTNVYGETKLAVENMLKWTDSSCGIKHVILRYFNVAGAFSSGEIGEDHRPETHLIPLVLQVPLGKRDSIVIFGDDYDTKDGTCVRDYIHIEDLVDAHILALNKLRNDEVSGVYNLGNGTGFSVKEIIESARRVTGHPVPSKIGKRRLGDPSTLIAASQKAKEDLGWSPRFTDIDSIMGSAWKWHKNHPNGFDK